MQTLAEHLVAAYPELDADRVLTELWQSTDAAAFVGLGEHDLMSVELVARARLELLACRREDAARWG